MLRTSLLAAAATMAIAAPAAAETSGFVDLGYEATEMSWGDFDVVHLGAGFHHDFSNGWSIQGDARQSNQSHDGSSGDDSHSYAALHAYYGINDHWDVGGFAGLIEYYGTSGYMAGLESRKHIGNFSFQGSIGYADFDAFTDFAAWDYRLTGAYFFTPNFAAHAGVGHTEWDWVADPGATDWTLGATFQLSSGLAFYGEFTGTDGGHDFSDWDGESVRVGLRWNINGGDLQNVVNEGASWYGGAAMQERMMRW